MRGKPRSITSLLQAAAGPHVPMFGGLSMRVSRMIRCLASTNFIAQRPTLALPAWHSSRPLALGGVTGAKIPVASTWLMLGLGV